MKDFKSLKNEEYYAVFQIRDILNHLSSILCATCRYCVDGCPKHIFIPDLFSYYNAKNI